MVAAGELIRIRRGLYWRGDQTRFGMVRPSPLAVAFEVVGPGSGPAGVTAAQLLGLTTQVPATVVVAVPGRAPARWPGVRFVRRPTTRRALGLRPVEVAVLEALADPYAIEVSWTVTVERVAELTRDATVRLPVIARAVAAERSVGLRERWEMLCDDLRRE